MKINYEDLETAVKNERKKISDVFKLVDVYKRLQKDDKDLSQITNAYWNQTVHPLTKNLPIKLEKPIQGIAKPGIISKLEYVLSRSQYLN